MRTKANKDLTLRQRDIVSREISREFDKWRRKKGEPTEADRRQIVAIGFSKARKKDSRIPKANPINIGAKLITDIIGGIGFGVGAGITERYIMSRKKNPAANPPRFAVLDPEGTIVYAKVATGTGDVALRAAHQKARELARKTGRTYFVWLSLTHKVGAQLNLAILPGAYPVSPATNPLTEEERHELRVAASGLSETAQRTRLGRQAQDFMEGSAHAHRVIARDYGPEGKEWRTGVFANNPRRRTDDIDSVIEQAYYRHSSGTQISIMDIPKLFRDVKLEIAGGTDLDTAVQNAIARYRANPLLTSENPDLDAQENPLLMTVLGANPKRRRRSCPTGKVRSRRGRCVKPIGYRAKRGKLYGWKMDASSESRRRALRRSINADGYTTTIRRLYYLVNISGSQKTRMVARQDARWMKDNEQALKARKRVRVAANPSHTRRLKNPGRTKRKVTMSIQRFWDHLKRKGDPKLLAEFKKKIEGYRKWTHGSMPRTVTLELKNVPGMSGIWMTYGMGVQPESTYIMPKGSKRKGAWKHKWERHPELKGDPESGLILTQLARGNKLTNFMHG